MGGKEIEEREEDDDASSEKAGNMQAGTGRRGSQERAHTHTP